ncbi:hypothetical protein [Rugamonas sp. DEMB1]|uniref:hypothetical protein n=1 Tax=Rugamonas sp. DEMB1 TaxID=3039386 RepID=UPI002449065F|nr:hypothetical protein [Rugamonas sp. DEMB1]WGG53444.1 hypothetical protein QC826_10505 [Rugamonas sp. DEMB1]
MSARPSVPVSADCRCMLADGRVLTITASRRPRANRADVKCALHGAPALAERVQEVVRLARHTEARFDSRDQVVLSMDLLPAAGERDWELAAVLADRMVRGEYRSSATALYAQGWSDAWHLGQVSGRSALATASLRRHLAAQAVAAPAAATGSPTAAAGEPASIGIIVGGDSDSDGAAETDAIAALPAVLRIAHLGALSGHTDPASGVSTARAWFPLHSGGVNDALGWVDVSVYPIVASGGDEEDTIAAPGLDASTQLALRQALVGARHFDGRGLGRWRTVVRFGQPRFEGNSYQLALVMADRLARGREFVPRGRLIASGCSSAWHAGRVESVEGLEAKTALILRQVVEGDRVLLPKEWQAGLPAGFAAAVKGRGASVACIERIGVI